MRTDPGDQPTSGPRLGGWTVEHVAALAPSPSQFAAADECAAARRWSEACSCGDALWGTYRSSGSEPYDVAVDLAPARVGAGTPRTRCSCPSRKLPCKHAVALLLRWVRSDLAAMPPARVPERVVSWATRHATPTVSAAPSSSPASTTDDTVGGSDEPTPPPEPAPAGDETSGRDERVDRMVAGLVELDRWLLDRMRSGLADPELARYATWDHLAARLVDARAGALANRVRRLAGLVGASPHWHGDVLSELGMLHLVARGGLALRTVPEALGDSLGLALGWQVRQADVLAVVPETDTWDVIGRSDTREDRIEVRRTWLRGRRGGRLAMVLSFAAYRQALDASLTVGSAFEADLHRYPGGGARALVGERRGETSVAPQPVGVTLVDACAHIGAALATEPWSERTVVTVLAALTSVDRRWVLADRTGSLPCVSDQRAVGAVLATTGGAPAPITAEWTPGGLVLLAVHLDDRAVDVGPRADPSFVMTGAA